VLLEERLGLVQFTSFHKGERAHTWLVYDLIVLRLPIKEKPWEPTPGLPLRTSCSIRKRV
jgi:hypothetical protein